MNRAPAPLHVPDFSLVPQDDRRSDVLPPLPSLQALLQAPLPDVRLLGHIPGASDAAFNRAELTDSPVRKLAETTERLVPMIDSFRRPKDGLAHWWQRFTGLALERELTYWHACTQLENSAAAGKRLALQVQGVAQALAEERQRATQEAQWLGQVVHIGQLVLQPQFQAQRSAAVFADQSDYWVRFARRIDNLNALHNASLLSAEQLKLAQAQANAVQDRFAEVLTVLLPLWRQRIGFELFSKQFSLTNNEEQWP